MSEQDEQPTIQARRNPAIELVLSGTWTRVPVGNRESEQALIDLLRSAGPEGEELAVKARAHLDQLARSGGERLLLRRDQPTFLTIAWPPVLPPPAIFAGGDAAIRSLQREAGAPGKQIRSKRGYHVIRVSEKDGEAPSSTYWIAHPDSGRILVIFVQDYIEGHGSDWLYDMVVGSITWPDRSPFSKSG